MAKIGIIGGSGLDNPNILKSAKDIELSTPYGDTSSKIMQGIIMGQNVSIIARHGRDHSIAPSNINYRANIWALNEIGCTHLIATTAVGSLRSSIKPGDIVLPDQFIDFTKRRASTFFDENSDVVHTEMANPFSEQLIKEASRIASDLEISFHHNKTVITIEGPRFSTKSESNMFRSWNADIINMSSCPEVILAKELGLKYLTLAMSTDYDCWKEDEDPVSWEMIKETMSNNSSNVIRIIKELIPRISTLE
ncbi:S-methyl-5'-thioadenosine phosphorylase [Gammaproteobacteria bacterium]|nr:S-methyl-5'-thioadenosine phosphorylase [Gammaproteobacteria bacterium]